MNEPSAEQLAKLPKWAQEHIATIQRQRDNAVNTLNKSDSQAESAIYYDPWVCTGEKSGPSLKRQFVQSEHICVNHLGILLRVGIGTKDSQRGAGIHLQWDDPNRLMNHIAMIPTSFQACLLATKDLMR